MAKSESDQPLDELARLIIESIEEGGVSRLLELSRSRPDITTKLVEKLPDLYRLQGDADSPKTETAPGLAVPRELGDYRIKREIGRGGMGIVFEAEQISLHRRVALKILPRHALMDERQLERFRLESRAAGRLRHDNIVPVFASGVHEGLHYFVMQFIDGQGLERVIRALRREREAADSEFDTEDGASIASFVSFESECLKNSSTGDPLAPTTEEPRAAPESDAVEVRSESDSNRLESTTSRADVARCAARIIHQVADALAHAHERGILHRDIKPSNLLVDAEGRVWVTDFGLAKVDQGHELTMSDEVVGTLRYMAPERFSGWSDARSDVYSLGLVLYELLTLQPAFPAQGRVELMREVIEGEIIPPRRLEPTTPRDLDTIVMKAVDPIPGRRYQTAAAFASDLELFLDGRPVSARGIAPWERIAKWSRRHPGTATAALVSIIAALASVIAVVFYLDLGVLDDYLQKKSPAIDIGEARLEYAKKEVLIGHGYSELGHGDPLVAAEVFEEIIAKDDEAPDPEAVAGLALVRATNQDAAGALAILDRYPELEAEHFGLAWLRQRLREIGGLEVEDLEKSRPEGPSTAIDHFTMGSWHLQRGHRIDSLPRTRPLQAEGAYRAALERFELAMQLAEEAREFYAREAIHAAGHCRSREAITKIAAYLVREWPNSFDAWYWAGYGYFRIDLPAAIPYFEHAHRIGEATQTSASHLADAYSGAERLEDAVGMYERAVSHDQPFGPDLRSLAEALWRLDRKEEAEKRFHQVIKAYPKDDLARFLLGELLFADGRLDEAEEMARHLAESGNSYPERYVNLSADFYTDERGDIAIALLERAVDRFPGHAVSLHNLGFIYFVHGRWEESARLLHRSTQSKEDYVNAHFHLGRVLYRLDRPQESIASYRRAIELDTSHGNAWCEMGWPLRARGEFQESINAYEKGESLGALNAEWPHDRGQWLEQGRHLVELETELARIRVEGWVGVEPKRLLDLAEVAVAKRLFLLGGRIYRGVFDADPSLMERKPRPHRLRAALAAAAIARKSDPESAYLSIEQRTEWSNLALTWLDAELVYWIDLFDEELRAASRAANELARWFSPAAFGNDWAADQPDVATAERWRLLQARVVETRTEFEEEAR